MHKFYRSKILTSRWTRGEIKSLKTGTCKHDTKPAWNSHRCEFSHDERPSFYTRTTPTESLEKATKKTAVTKSGISLNTTKRYSWQIVSGQTWH